MSLFSKIIKKGSIATLCALSLALPVIADDIDIYATSGQASAGAPQVMFSIDWRPNLSSTVCQGSVEVGGVSVNECQFLIDENYLVAAPTSFFNLLRAVIKRVLSSLSGIEVGVMLSHDQGTGRSCAGPHSGVGRDICTNGGYILKGLTSVDDSIEMADLYARLDAIPAPQGNASHKYQGAELFFELFRYLTGQDVYNGHNGWTDFGTDDDYNLDDNSDVTPTTSAPLKWDTDIENLAGTTYISPLSAGVGECGGGLYTINVLFQVSQQEDDSDDAITAGSGGLTNINMRPPFSTGGRFARVVEYLNDQDLSDDASSNAGNIAGTQNVTSYFLVDPTHINNTTNAYANAGGTGSALPLADDPNELIETIEDIFDQILSVSTTFVSAALPLNVFNRVDLVDDVYLAIFRADPDAKPFWNGNLKKLRLIDSGGTPVLIDAGNNSAINPLDGRIKQTALTFWTNSGDIPAPPDGETDYALGKDGRATDKGGGGGVIPGYRSITAYTPGTANPLSGTTTEAGPRRLYTEPASFTDGNDSTLMDFNATVAVAANLLGADTELFKTVLPDSDCSDATVCSSYASAVAADKTEAASRMKDLISFARGFEDGDDDDVFDDKRSWFMGDPLHSRPQPINYGGSSGSSDIRILMASNDGYMHMFGANDGVEDWAFMPRSVMPVLERLSDNNAGTSPVHPYAVDSSAIVLTNDINNDGTLSASDGDTVYAYFGLRRGGKHVYALNISDPDNPKLLWRLGPEETDYAELSQSWSRPKPVFVKYDDDDNDSTAPIGLWALIFGGGYNGDDDGDDVADTGEADLGKDEFDADDATHTGSDDYQGNAVFIVNALTGQLIWKATGPQTSIESVTTGPVVGTRSLYRHADLKDSIAAEISTSNGVPNAYHDRAYVGDTGGKIWRVDYLDEDPENWKLTQLVSIGRHYSSGTTANDRRFYHAVDIVRAEDALGEFDAVIAGTGTRANPLSSATENYLYMVKDRNTTSAANDSSLNHSNLQDLTNNCLQDDDASDCVGVVLTDDDSDAATPDVPIISALEHGWKIKLEQCDGDATTGNCGEKNLSKPTTFLGKVFFTTYLPPGSDSGSCEPSEGVGLRYIVSLQKGTAVRNFNTANDTSTEITYERFEKLASGGIPSQVIRAGIQNDKTIFINPDLSFETDEDLSYLKTYWYKNLQQ
jgi:type IV pilus assembly protein PilY1